MGYALKEALRQAHEKGSESSNGMQPSGNEGRPAEKKALLLLELAEGEAVDAAVRRLGMVMAELHELARERRWEEMVELVHPVEEKYPLLVELGMDGELRCQAAFALVRCNRFEEAIAALKPAIEREPDSYRLNYSMGYAAYDALYRDRGREVVLTPARRRELIALAKAHLRRCTELESHRVTPWYRLGMVAKEFEDKPRRAVPCFQRAVANWDGLPEEERRRRHQERPKFIKALYHLAACLLKVGRITEAKGCMERVLKEDESTDFVDKVFKHYAMAKVLYAALDLKGALDHLEVAAAAAHRRGPPDFVVELKAAVLLRLGKVQKALDEIRRIPARFRRPYVRWREAEILAALDRREEALTVLEESLGRDHRSRHKSLIRMSAILHSLGRHKEALARADQACRFHQERFGTRCKEGEFYKGVALAALGRLEEAEALFDGLAAAGFQYPGFGKARRAVRERLKSLGSQGDKRLSVVK